MPTEPEKPAWAAALGKVPSGLFVVTMAGPQGITGMLGSWVQQCSFNPPLLTIAFGNDRPIIEWLAAGTIIGLNVVPEGAKSLIAHFGKGFAPGVPAFEGIAHDHEPGTSPRLTAALAWLDTRVVSSHVAGDHTLAIVRVVDGLVMHEGKPTVHIRRDGTRY